MKSKKEFVGMLSRPRLRQGLISVSGACAMLASAASMSQVNVQVNFDATGCPQPPVIDVVAGRGQQVVWQAYIGGAAASVPFKIFFDPLRGQPHNGPQGTIRANVDSGSPSVNYKYTIVGDNCPQAPLDPNFRVN